MATGIPRPPPAGRIPGRTDRLVLTVPFLAAGYGLGLVFAAWDPRPTVVITAALSVSTGILVLGPYSAAAIYGLRLQHIARGYLRWPLCIVLAASAVLLPGHLLRWSAGRLAVAMAASLAGTVLGHDASLAVLSLRTTGRLDLTAVLLFPLLLGLALMAGYSCFGLVAGLYQFLIAVWSGI